MFKKFKDKLAEEMKQSPARLQASMQQLAQAVVSPALSTSSIQELSASNDNFSLTEEGDETPKNSPAKHGFQNVDLMSPTPNSMGISRRSSINSVTSDTSSLFPIYESPANLYHLQSDMDQSASEIEENINSQLDKVTKDQIYSAYRKVQAKYHKYRGRYTDLATHYRELERVKGKVESILVETQDKALRRVVDLKEQCQLEQQAKAHLEEALRNDIEEKDHIINTLNTKIKLLQSNGQNIDAIMSSATNTDKGNAEGVKDNLIDLNTNSLDNSTEHSLLMENTQLKDKLKKLENVVLKYKESLKRNKEKFTEVLAEKNTLECNYAELKSSYAEKDTELNNAHTEIRNLADQIIILKKREEESAISLAENKLSIHRELEDKEEQIKKLQLDLKNMAESKESLNEVVKKYKIELEKLKLIPSTQNVDSEKKDIVQDVLRGKSEVQQKPIILENKIDVKPHEGDSNKENTKEMEETRIEDSEVYKNLKCKLDEKETELQKLKNTLGALQKLAEEYQNNKDKLCMELSDYKLRYTELKSEQDAQKIIAEEKKKEAEAMVEKLQATVQNLDKELENMRSALIDRDKVCENYNAKVNEYKLILEKANEKLLAQDVEMKTLKEKEQQNTDMIKLKNELENKVSELLETCNEHQSCKSIISDLKNKLQMHNSDIDLLREEKNNLIKNILNHKISVQKLKTDNKRIKSDVTEHFMQFTNEIFGLKNVLDMCLEKKDAIKNFEAEDLQIKLKELEEFKQKYNELQKELQDTICIKSNLQANLDKYNEQLKEMSTNLEQQNEIDVKNRKLIAEIDNLNFKLYDLRNVSDEMNSLKDESKFLKEDLINVNTSNQLLSDEISDLKTQLEKANNIKKELQEEYLNTMSLYKSEISKCNKLEETINSLQSEITGLNEIISEKDKQVNILNDELRNKESTVTNLKDECEDHTKVIGKLTKDKKALQKTIQVKLNQLKESKAIEEKQALIIQQLNDEISKIKTTNTELLEQLKIFENEINVLKSENDQIITLKNNNSSITSELEQLKSVQHTIDLENKNLKDTQNEFLKRNQELHECNEKLKQEIVNYKKHNEQLLNNNEQLEKAIESHKSSLNGQKQDIQNLNSQIVALTAELQSKTENLNLQIEEFKLCKQEAEEMKDHFTKENKNLHNEICKLDVALKNRESTEEKNKELLANLELLEKELARLKVIEEENSNLKLEINSLNETKINSEKMQLQYNELSNEYVTLKNKVTELENVNSINVELQSHVNNVEAKISSLELVESNNSKLQLELNTLKDMNTELLTQVSNKSIEMEQLLGELGELKLTVDEKVAELKLLDTKNMELLREIERLKSLTIEDEAITETDTSKNTIECMKDEIARLQTEAEILKKSNIVLQEKVQNGSANKTIDDSFIKESDRLQEENKKLEAQLDEALITFQAKELQMQIVNNELKSQADKLKEELKTNEEEQSMRLKQLVKEFQAQLHDKEEELHAALEKRFDRQQNYESNLIQQYKEQLKDFQIELTTKSEQIENLILENKNLIIEKNKDINQLMEKITVIKKEHADEMREIEKKWKSIVQQKTDKLEAKHEDEINELTREWRNERRPDVQNDLTYKELESTSRVAMAAVQSNTGSFHTLQQTLTAQRRELAELRKLVKLRHDTLEDSTEIEYLRNILFEYMMGKETMVLARVIAAVVKFDQDQTAKILKKEEDKMTLLGSLGLT